ncbi:transcription antitermination factor NusB [Serinicoccus sp. CNJ-927]|uniref:transcription antitermination factor NusB n=1 Tax=Serinicoccus TaxID=265976 RepID=UPI0003B68D0D|nr:MULTISPECIES: transcription antitermination factor NusB [Serinicoccus]OLT18544.1 transcription antitermination factor NusB [Serinicoccus sp. CUA-874]OLT44157.1 transcription antitermination factor NusB [Serinicoccus sp. CNJ-927]
MAARTRARKRALELLFEAEQRGVNVAELLEQRIEAPTTQHALPDYTVEVVRGVVSRWGQIEEVLATWSQGWSLDRMAAVDRAALRVGTWEILWNDEVPDMVAVSEAVELVQRMSTDESPGFVNGLLARISEVKPTIV